MLNRACVSSLLVVAANIPSAVAQCENTPPYSAPDEALVGAGFGNAVAISADGTIVLVAGSGFWLGDGVVRTFEKIAGDWIEGWVYQGGAFVGENFGYAIAADGVDTIIGEPGYQPNFDLYQMGRVHLSGQVFRDAPFSVVAAQSTLDLEIIFPGVPVQFIAFILEGFFGITLPETCEDTDPVSQIQLVGGTLSTDSGPVDIEVSPGVWVTISGITLSVAGPMPPSTLDLNGSVSIVDAGFILEGDIEFLGVPIYHAAEPVTIPFLPINVTGDAASGMTIEIPSFNFDPQIDVGPDVVQPTINATMALTADESDPPCNIADFASRSGCSISPMFLSSSCSSTRVAPDSARLKLERLQLSCSGLGVPLNAVNYSSLFLARS